MKEINDLEEIKWYQSKFKTYINIFIEKYECALSFHSNKTFTLSSIIISVLLAILTLAIPYSLKTITSLFSKFVSLNLSTYFLIFLGLIAIYQCLLNFLSFISFEGTGGWLGFNKLKIINKNLNKLYLAKLDPKGWILSFKRDEKEGLFELVKIEKKKK